MTGGKAWEPRRDLTGVGGVGPHQVGVVRSLPIDHGRKSLRVCDRRR